jgi:hypothetical protein
MVRLERKFVHYTYNDQLVEVRIQAGDALVELQPNTPLAITLTLDGVKYRLGVDRDPDVETMHIFFVGAAVDPNQLFGLMGKGPFYQQTDAIEIPDDHDVLQWLYVGDTPLYSLARAD